MSKPNLNSFKEAYGNKTSSMWVTCACGEEFGDDEQNPLIANWYGLIQFEGKTYVEDCTCWHARAQNIADWIDYNKREIAKYLQLEKVRLTEFANEHPTIEI